MLIGPDTVRQINIAFLRTHIERLRDGQDENSSLPIFAPLVKGYVSEVLFNQAILSSLHLRSDQIILTWLWPIRRCRLMAGKKDLLPHMHGMPRQKFGELVRGSTARTMLKTKNRSHMYPATAAYLVSHPQFSRHGSYDTVRGQEEGEHGEEGQSLC